MSNFERARDAAVALLTADPDGYFTGTDDPDFSAGDTGIRDAVLEYLFEGLLGEAKSSHFAKGLSGTLNLTTTLQTVPFDTPTITDASVFSASAGVITVNEDGRYALSFALRLGNAGVDLDYEAQVVAAGSAVHALYACSPMSSLGIGQIVTLVCPPVILDLSAGDTIEVTVKDSAGGGSSSISTSDSSFLSIETVP